ncbi:UNKNOWN [Stylonychia lemnae]|uniref:Uncharacterized protein n=1 Tax=Stylonychia lemnae TaxID=5949 RepID=A0A078B171_STYLE|nr:UNKNOWN [Stylonychia lemnae]|eukprot:CDW88076.1 UNKNOWN [Stylonychia lemnae]
MSADNKKIFVTSQPYIGQVSMLFYVPECEEKEILASLIEKHGGRCSNIHDCSTYQIRPINCEVSHKEYFQGEIYSAIWLTESIKSGQLEDETTHLFAVNSENELKIKRLELHKSQNYTITEAIKIYEIASSKENKHRSQSAAFWKEVSEKGIIPGRTGESMRNFLKKSLKLGLEAYLKGVIADSAKYSHFFFEIPKPSNKSSDITRQEREYLRMAPPKHYNRNGAIDSKIAKTYNKFMQQQQDFKVTDSLNTTSGNAGQNRKQSNGRGVVALNLRDLGQGGETRQSLGQVFNILEQEKLRAPKEQEDQDMVDESNDKENTNSQNLIMNQEELLDAAESEQILVFKKFGEEKRQVNLTNGQEAFFALLAQDLMEIADNYKRDIDEVHKIFFEVSCDREKLKKVLDGQKIPGRWQILEDLALKDTKTLSSYQYVTNSKGEDEVLKRQKFLEYRA